MTKSGFKKIYFSAMALISVLLLVFSFVTYYYGSGSSGDGINDESIVTTATKLAGYERSAYSTNGLSTASDEIRSYLTREIGTSLNIAKQGDITNESSQDSKIMDVNASGTGGAYNAANGAAYVYMNFADSRIDMGVDDDTCHDMTGNHSNIIPAKQPKNHIVIIPGTDSKSGTPGEAVLFMTHYDSMPGSNGATNAVNVASMLEVIKYASTQAYANDLVFLFTDGRYEDSVSAYAFKNQFVGLDNVVSRIKAAFNFDSFTAGGHLAVIQSTEYDSGIMSAFASCAGSTYSDSIMSRTQEEIISSDFEIFYDKDGEEWIYPAVNLMFINGKYDAETKYDTLDNLDVANAAGQSASLMRKLTDKFGDINLGDMSTMRSAYASYLGLNLSASSAVIYVLATLLLVLACVIFFFTVKKKQDIAGLFKGLMLTLGVTAASIAIFFGAYFLITLLLFLFGTISLRMIITMQLLSAAVLIPAIFFVAAVGCGLYPLFKRAFRVKATDCARGAPLLWIIFAIIVGFVYPPAALQLLVTGILIAVVMLVVIFIKEPVKNKFGVDVNRYMPYAWPMILAMPFVIPAIMNICNLYMTLLLPVLMGLFAIMLSTVTPYFDFLKPKLTELFAKLPKHKIVVDQSVSREVEDAAKKGKFETVTTREIMTKEVAWKYHNWFGVTVICAVTAVILLICAIVGSLSGVVYGSSVVSTFNQTNDLTYESIYSNSLIYYVEKGDSGSSATAYWLIKDESFFTKTRPVSANGRYFINDFDWDANTETYKHPLSYFEDEHPVKKSASICSKGESKDGVFSVNVTPYTDNSQAVLTFDGTSGVNKIEIENARGQSFVIDVSSSTSTMTITLPYNFGDCTIDFYGTMTSSSLTAYEYIFDADKVRAKITDDYIDAVSEYYPEADYGIIIKYSYGL